MASSEGLKGLVLSWGESFLPALHEVERLSKMVLRTAGEWNLNLLPWQKPFLWL